MQCKEQLKTVTALNKHKEKLVCILCNRHFNSIDESKEPIVKYNKSQRGGPLWTNGLNLNFDDGFVKKW